MTPEDLGRLAQLRTTLGRGDGLTHAESRDLYRYIELALDALTAAAARAVVVDKFLAERDQFITAIKNCPPGNRTDYWRWQGHAEARRVLAEDLAKGAP